MNLLLLDDDDDLGRLLEGVLEADGMWVVPFLDPAEAVTSVAEGSWLAAMVSLDLPDGQAQAFLGAISLLEEPVPPVILVSSKLKDWDEAVDEARDLAKGALFLRKPIPLLDLNDLLRGLREGGEPTEDFARVATSPSISVELDGGHEVDFIPDSVPSEAETDVESSGARHRSMRGALDGLARGRSDDEILDVDPSDLTLLEEGGDPQGSSTSFDLEIEDEDSEEVSAGTRVG